MSILSWIVETNKKKRLNKRMQGKVGLKYVTLRLRPYLELRQSIPTVLFAMMVMTMLFIGEPPYALADEKQEDGIKTAQRDNVTHVEKLIIPGKHNNS